MPLPTLYGNKDWRIREMNAPVSPTKSTPMATAGSELITQADIEKFERTPLSQRYPWDNSYELIKHACDKWGDDIGLEFLLTGVADEPSLAISYRQLGARITQTANLFHSIGVHQQDAVSIMLPSLPETYYTQWGAQAAGICSPLNPMLEAHHLAEIMAVTSSRVLVTTAPISGNPELWNKAVELVNMAPAITHMVVVQFPGLTDAVPSAPREGLTMIDYQAEVDRFNPDTLDSGRQFHGDQPAAYMHTGGTTGRPKVAQLNHSNFAFIAQMLQDTSSHKSRYCSPCALPLFHIFGLVVTGIAAIVCGRNVVIMTPSGFRNPNVIANFWAHVERFKFHGLAAVPTILSVLYDIPKGDHDVSSLEEVISGAAPLANRLKTNFEQRYDCWVRNGYGMTETTAVLAHTHENSNVPMGSCGLRVPYGERIVAHVDGNQLVKVCGPNEAGVVLARGPNIFAGYLEDEDNANAWVDGWFNTGDMGYLDEQGFLFLTGRAKDLIIRGGHNIDPALIEEVLLNHPDVANVVAVGQPDPHAGELPMAFVVPIPGHSINPQTLLSHCQQHISERAAIPKHIEVIEAIPLTAVGKVFKPRLREMAADLTLQSTLQEAGIQAEVEAYTDPLKGLCATVRLLDPRQREALQTVLQSLPIHIELA